jgi:hypothetical protein
MTALFQRDYLLVIGDRDITGLDVQFQVKKSLKPEPNTCELKIYNLSADTRETLSKPGVVNVRLDAGYTKALSQIYLGQARYSYSFVSKADIITIVKTGDSAKEVAKNRVKVPMGPKASASDALDQITRALELKPGNLAKAKAQLAAKGKALYPLPFIIYGSAADVMNRFCASAGLEWSVQDGQLQILDIGKALESNPYKLSSDSGLIGSPTIDSEGVVEASILMIPNIRPGVKVQFDSEFVKGAYRVTTAEYSGDTNGDDWGIKVHCKKIKT